MSHALRHAAVARALLLAMLPLADGSPFSLARVAAGVAFTDVNNLPFTRPFDNGGTSTIARARLRHIMAACAICLSVRPPWWRRKRLVAASWAACRI